MSKFSGKKTNGKIWQIKNAKTQLNQQPSSLQDRTGLLLEVIEIIYSFFLRLRREKCRKTLLDEVTRCRYDDCSNRRQPNFHVCHIHQSIKIHTVEYHVTLISDFLGHGIKDGMRIDWNFISSDIAYSFVLGYDNYGWSPCNISDYYNEFCRTIRQPNEEQNTELVKHFSHIEWYICGIREMKRIQAKGTAMCTMDGNSS